MDDCACNIRDKMGRSCDLSHKDEKCQQRGNVGHHLDLGKVTSVAKGLDALHVEEDRDGRGVPRFTQRAIENMTTRSSTQSLERIEPHVWDVMHRLSPLRKTST